MILRAVLAFLALPTLVAGVFPLLISWIPSPDVFKSYFRSVLISVGGSILLVSVVSFCRRGRGTLAPWDPPKHLVVQDLYRFNRNPMYVGVVMVLLGWALLTGNLWNYLYAVLVYLMFHLRVVLYEERERSVSLEVNGKPIVAPYLGGESQFGHTDQLSNKALDGTRPSRATDLQCSEHGWWRRQAARPA